MKENMMKTKLIAFDLDETAEAILQILNESL